LTFVFCLSFEVLLTVQFGIVARTRAVTHPIYADLPAHTRRGKTISRRDLQRARMLPAPYPDVERPVTRADCEYGPRPCPWVSCRHHLYLDVTPSGGLHLNHYGIDVDEVPATCSLDLTRREGMTIDEVGDVLGITRERARQIEHQGIRKIRHLPLLRDIAKAG